MSTLTPENQVTEPQPPENNDGQAEVQIENHSGMPLWLKRTLGIVAIVVTAGGTAEVVNVINDNNNKVKASDSSDKTGNKTAPVAEHTKAPAPITTKNVDTLTVKSVEIPAGLSTLQTATDFVNDISNWGEAGRTDANDIAIVKSEKTPGTIAAANKEIYKQGLFAPYATGSQIDTTVNNLAAINSNIVEDWFITYKSDDPADIQPFEQTMSIDPSVAPVATPGSDNTETITFSAIEKNNAADNRIGTKYDPSELTINGEKVTGSVTLEDIDGVEKVSDYSLGFQ
jgi:hypothetical protein